jgi:mono/diheme cytochrome c family protein
MRRIAPLLILLLACSGTTVRFGAHQRRAPAVVVNNPSLWQGDAKAGRRVFINHSCIECHRVEEDPALPPGRRSIAGPLLSHLDRYEPSVLADKIVSRRTGESEELFEKTMADFAQPLSARQLADVVAYLRHPRPPGV